MSRQTILENSAFMSGISAYRNLKEREENPFYNKRPLDPQRRAWFRGWDAAYNGKC